LRIPPPRLRFAEPPLLARRGVYWNSSEKLVITRKKNDALNILPSWTGGEYIGLVLKKVYGLIN
jgi:hypothetical protein